jgi:uncharacterized protein
VRKRAALVVAVLCLESAACALGRGARVEARPARRVVRILSIDGGGIRGLIPALVLEHLEKITGRRAAEQFDLIAGSSTGGIMTLLLTRPGPGGGPRFTAKDIVELYTVHGKDLFARDAQYAQLSQNGMKLPKYPATSVTDTLRPYFDDSVMKDALTDVLVTTYDLDHRLPQLFTRIAPGEGAPYMRDVAQATSAFPGLFPPAEVSLPGGPAHHLIDGGVVFINPALLAIAEARQRYGDTDIVLVSLGTGHYEAPLPYGEVSNWGMEGWSSQLVDVLFDGSNHGVNQALNVAMPSAFFRFQILLPAANDGTDDVRPENIEALRQLTAAAIAGAPTARIVEADEPWPGRFAVLARRLAEARPGKPR